MKNVSTRELEVAAMVAVYIRESEFAVTSHGLANGTNS